MSWDIYIKVDVCPACGRGDDYLYDRNYTSNMWPMLQKAGWHFDLINDKSTKEAYPQLRELIGKLEAYPAEYRALNPPNGWGDYDSFVEMLKEFAANCLAEDGVVQIR